MRYACKPRPVHRGVRALDAPTSVLTGLRDAAGLDVVWVGAPPQKNGLMCAGPAGHFDRAWASPVSIDIDTVRVMVVFTSELVVLARADGRRIYPTHDGSSERTSARKKR